MVTSSATKHGSLTPATGGDVQQPFPAILTLLGSPFPDYSPLQPQPLSSAPPRGVSQQSHLIFTLWALQTFFSSPLSNLGKKVYLNASSRLSLIYLAINKGHIFPTVPRGGFQKGTIV